MVLVAGGAALLWRQSLAGPDEAPAAAEAVAAPGPEADRLRARRRAAVVSRTGLGVVLVLGAGVAFLFSTGALGAARDVAVAAVVVVVALAIILAPFAARLLRSLADERADRASASRSAPRSPPTCTTPSCRRSRSCSSAPTTRAQVATLARRQERELRAWLGRAPGDGTAGGAPTLGAALEAVAGDVEATHRVAVEVVAVGDADARRAAARRSWPPRARRSSTPPSTAAASRSASSPRRRRTAVEVFVRDRGPGFDPAAVPGDRRGVRESIVGRMARHGGTRARSTPTPGVGHRGRARPPREAP